MLWLLFAVAAAVIALAAPQAQASTTVFNAPFNTNFNNQINNSAPTVVGNPGPSLSSSEAYAPNTQSLEIPGANGNYLIYQPVNLGTDNFTISADVYLTGNISQYASVFSEWGNQEAFQLNIDSNDSVQFEAETAANGQITLNTTTPLPLDTWEVVTAQRVDDEVTVSVNGTEVGSTAISGAIDTNTNGLWVGELDCGNYTVCWAHANPFYLNNLVITDNSISAAPEPAAWALMIAGLGGVGLMLRRAKTTEGLRVRSALAA